MITQTPAQARTDRVVRALVRNWIWLLNGCWCSMPVFLGYRRGFVRLALSRWALRSIACVDVGSLNFWPRMATGTLFGIGIMLWTYPHVQREFGQA